MRGKRRPPRVCRENEKTSMGATWSCIRLGPLKRRSKAYCTCLLCLFSLHPRGCSLVKRSLLLLAVPAVHHALDDACRLVCITQGNVGSTESEDKRKHFTESQSHSHTPDRPGQVWLRAVSHPPGVSPTWNLGPYFSSSFIKRDIDQLLHYPPTWCNG